MVDTLIADAAPASDTSAAAPPAAAAGAAPPPADGQQQQQASETGQATPTGEGQGAGNEQAANGGDPQSGEAAAGEGGAVQGAPEQYAAFAMPDGFALDGDMLSGVSTLAKGLNLSQEQAQGIVDLGVKQAQTILDAVSKEPVPFAQQWHDAWKAQTAADPEIGGDHLAAVLPVAKQALDTFASPALTQLLTQTGLGSHPEVIRFLNKVGKAVSEDTLVTANGSERANARRDPARTLYPNMN